MTYIIGIMHNVMKAIQGFTGAEWGWGLAIIGLTLLVRLIILPLTVIQGRTNAAVQAMQPELNRLQKKYKDDPDRLNLEMMDLYKQYKVNPMMGCLLPLIIQWPILMAMIRALDYEPMKEARFLGLALGGQGGLLMGVIAVATTYLSMKFSPAMAGAAQEGKAQNASMIAMMGIMFYFSWKFSIAVSIYIITANLAGLLERYLVPRPATPSEGASSSEKR